MRGADIACASALYMRFLEFSSRTIREGVRQGDGMKGTYASRVSSVSLIAFGTFADDVCVDVSVKFL